MNIGIDIRALGNKKLTGIGKYIYSAVDNLSKIDKANNYILLSSGLRREAYDHLEFNSPNIKHRHFTVSNKVSNFSLVTGYGPNICKKFFEDIDFFWMPNINFCRINNKKPMVLTIHDLSFLHSREFYSLRRRYWHRLVNVGKLVKRANKIIAVSANTKRDIVRFFPTSEDKISIINPGVEVATLDNTQAEELIAPFALPEKYFIYVGTLEPRKNIDSIIKAFDRYHLEHPEVALVIVGALGWVYKKLLKKIHSRSYVHYLGYVDSPAKDALYKKSQGLIWPSFYEGFGFPPMEAAYHQIPLIVSYKTSLPETLKGQALYVDPYNISDIFHALIELTEDAKLRKQFKKSAESFSIPQWPEQAKKIMDLFNNLNKK